MRAHAKIGKKRKVGAEAGAAPQLPQLPQLPDELWEKIFGNASRRVDADLATLRLVNKGCAKRFAFTQCGDAMKRVFSRQRLKRKEAMDRETESILGTDTASMMHIESRRGLCGGRVQGDLQMERFVWELCTAYSARRDKVERLSKRQRKKEERVLLLKASIDALLEMGF